MKRKKNRNPMAADLMTEKYRQRRVEKKRDRAAVRAELGKLKGDAGEGRERDFDDRGKFGRGRSG